MSSDIVSDAYVGVALMKFARTWHRGHHATMLRVAISCAEGSVASAELEGWCRIAAIETALSRCAAIATVALDRT